MKKVFVVLLCLAFILTGVMPVLAADPLPTIAPPNLPTPREITIDGQVHEEGTEIPLSTALTAGGINTNEDILIGPFDVSAVVQITSESVERVSKERWIPGDKLATVSWGIENLTSERKYISQYCWGTSESGYLPIRVEYGVSGAGGRVSSWSDKFSIDGDGEILLTVTVYLGWDAPATKNATVHVVRPRLATPPTEISAGKG